MKCNKTPKKPPSSSLEASGVSRGGSGWHLVHAGLTWQQVAAIDAQVLLSVDMYRRFTTFNIRPYLYI